jgi:hypothetical protein
MDEKIDQAIEKVLGMIRTNMTPTESQTITQAVLNLAHAKTLAMGCAQSKRKGKDTGEP